MPRLEKWSQMFLNLVSLGTCFCGSVGEKNLRRESVLRRHSWWWLCQASGTRTADVSPGANPDLQQSCLHRPIQKLELKACDSYTFSCRPWRKQTRCEWEDPTLSCCRRTARVSPQRNVLPSRDKQGRWCSRRYDQRLLRGLSDLVPLVSGRWTLLSVALHRLTRHHHSQTIPRACRNRTRWSIRNLRPDTSLISWDQNISWLTFSPRQKVCWRSNY